MKVLHLGEDIEAGRHDLASAQRLDQRGLVDQRAARHIDENALRTQCLQNFGINDIARLRAAGGDSQKNVNVSGERRKRRIIGIRYIALPMPAVIGDLQPERLGAPRDGLADAPQSKNAEPAPTQRGSERKGPLQPLAFA